MTDSTSPTSPTGPTDSAGPGRHQPYDGQMFPIPVGARMGPVADSGGEDSAPDDYPISTWVVVDEVVAPCTTDELAIGEPSVMDGLSFGWGRDTIIDQPGTNTCSFNLREELDPRGMGVNQIEDPTFSDPELNADRFPAAWPVGDGSVEIGGPSSTEEVLASNLLTDPGFEYGKGGFDSAQATLDVEHIHSGVQAVKVTPTAGSTTYDARCAFQAEEGKSYTFSAWQWVPSGTTRSRNLATGQGVMTPVTYNTDTVLFDQWQRVVLQTSPAASTGAAYVHLYGGDVAGQPVWYDDVGLAEGTDVDFNGDLPPDSEGIEYRWTGEPGASASEQYIPGEAGNADGYRVWLIGDKRATASSTPPAAPAPENGAMPVIPGQVLHLSIVATASVDRQVRWQVSTYGEDGARIGSSYVAVTPVLADTPTEIAGDYTVPDGVAYLAVAFVCDGNFGGTVTISDPEISPTGGSGTLDLIHVGSTVEVWSSADVPADDAEVMTHSGFSGDTFDTQNWTRISGGSGITIPPTIYPYQGSDPVVWFTRPNFFEDWSMEAAFAPSPFIDAADANPNAWDLIPKLLPGQSWTIHATVWLPPLTTITLAAWAYSGPHKSDLVGEVTVTGADMSATGVAEEMTGASGFYDLTATVELPADLADAAGYWIAPGFDVSTLPSPLTWADAEPYGWAWQDMVLRWIDLQRAGISYLSLLQEEASQRTVLVWSGEVTSLITQAAGNFAVTTAVTASDLSSILENVKVGDEPWPQQTVQQRADAIMALIPTAPPLVIDDGLQATLVSYRDVDSQAPLGLLQDLAQTCGGVLWITAHATQGAYLWMEDPRERSAVRRFAIDPDTGAVYITTDSGTLVGVAIVSAMDVLRDPVNWVQDVSQVITQVTVSWMEEIPPTEVGDETTTEDRTVITRDTQEIIDRYGIRDASLSTELTTAADAEDLAARILAMSRGTGWKADGLQMDTILLVRDIDTVAYPQRLRTVLDLLDATTRIGYAVTLIDMPQWTPAGAVRSLYIEGGTYTWDGRRWVLDLTATPSAGQGISARWEDFDGTGVTWEDFRPNKIKWLDAYGTSGPLITTPREETADA